MNSLVMMIRREGSRAVVQCCIGMPAWDNLLLLETGC